MSGSATAPGITMIGSSPGRQRSMLSGEPSDEPKNRLEVLKEKPSRGGAGARRGLAVLRGTVLRSSCGLVSSDSDTSNCGSGGAFSAA